MVPGTGNAVRMYAEASTQKDADALASEGVVLIILEIFLSLRVEVICYYLQLNRECEKFHLSNSLNQLELNVVIIF